MKGCKTCKKWPPPSALLQGRKPCNIMSNLLKRTKDSANMQVDAIKNMQEFTEFYMCAEFEQADESTLKLLNGEIDHKLKNIEGDTPAHYTRNNVIAVINNIRDELHYNAHYVSEDEGCINYRAVDISDVDMVIDQKIDEFKRGSTNE